MNTLIQTISNHLPHAAFTRPFFDAWLKSLVVLAVAAGLCRLCRVQRPHPPLGLVLAVASCRACCWLSCLPHAGTDRSGRSPAT